MGGEARSPVSDYLFVVVPGIGGSVLRDAQGEIVWGSGLASGLTALRSPDSLEFNNALEPTGLVTEASVLGQILIPGYDNQVAKLLNALKLGATDVEVALDGQPARTHRTVLLFPYDFRQGMHHNAERLQRHISERLNGNRRQVIVISHSMGGLIARAWWACHDGWKVCRAIYTLGTPHRGAPKALAWLVNGVRVGWPSVSFGNLTRVLQEWPAAYELLPRHPAIWDGARALFPYELGETVTGKGFSQSKAQAAYETHVDLEACAQKATQSVVAAGKDFQFASVRCDDHPTLSWAWLDADHLRVGKELPDSIDPWLPLGETAVGRKSRGDGTVPGFSTLPVDLDTGDPLDAEPYLRTTHQRHSHLPVSPALLQPMNRLAQGATRAIRGDSDAESPTLGVDLEDSIMQGDILPLRVTISNAQATAVKITVTDHASKLEHVIELESDGNHWSADHRIAEAGMFTVRVDASLCDSATAALQVRDYLAVLPRQGNEHEVNS